MNYRPFGTTDLRVAELGFGAWAIGGESYGTVDRREALRALAIAEEQGCNFVDTAAVYGNSEEILGEFLPGRRRRWIVATKYSGQAGGLRKLAETQLRRLKTDYIDFYQIHWAPSRAQEPLYEELTELKRAGKIRYAGVSLYSIDDIHRVLARADVDGIQLPCNLLQPDPYVTCRAKIASRGVGVIVRSALREGFLSGKFSSDSRFDDPRDRRGQLDRAQIATLVAQVDEFRFLEREAGSLFAAAVSYPFAFAETSVVILGTRTAEQAQANFGGGLPLPLSAQALQQIAQIQCRLGMRPGAAGRLAGKLKRAARRLLSR